MLCMGTCACASCKGVIVLPSTSHVSVEPPVEGRWSSEHIICYAVFDSLGACAQVYALDGRGRVTSRIYPGAVDKEWTLAVFGQSSALFFSADAAVHELGAAFSASQENVCC
jgi:hypothetical protein